jgi:hypothetical protein
MKGKILATFVLAFLIVTLWAGAVAAQRSPAAFQPQITVRIQDQVRHSAKDLERAKAYVKDDFRQVGIKVNWLDCTPVNGEVNPVCLVLLGPDEIDIRIVSRLPQDPKSIDPDALAWTFRLTRFGGSGYVSVFWNRIEYTASNRGASHAFVLGHVMTHGIGSLLLPMRASTLEATLRIDDKNWLRATHNLSEFTSDQIAAMLTAALERNNEQKAAAMLSDNRNPRKR